MTRPQPKDYRWDTHGSRWGVHAVRRDYKKCPICKELRESGAERTDRLPRTFAAQL